MGRQVNFFLSPSDNIALEEVIRASGEVTFLRDRPLSPYPEEIGGADDDWPRTLLARRADLKSLTFTPIRGRAEYTCDDFSQPIVQYDRCFFDPRFIREGRLFLQAAFYDENGGRRQKSDVFIAWSSLLFRRVRASLTKIDLWYYAGEEALALRRQGLAFEGVDCPCGEFG